MIKTLAGFVAMTTATTLAQAQPLPAPPTEKYVPVQEAACDSQVLNVYFQTGESDLNAASTALLKEAQAQLDGCILGPVSLQANAPDAATPIQAEQLATARLDTVVTALEAHDLTGTRVNASFDPSVAASALKTPMTRTVEVRLSAWAPQIG